MVTSLAGTDGSGPDIPSSAVPQTLQTLDPPKFIAPQAEQVTMRD